jgi:hypothetical protein
MAKQRPSAQKRDREFKKRERDRKKREKAAAKRERRLGIRGGESAPHSDAGNGGHLHGDAAEQDTPAVRGPSDDGGTELAADETSSLPGSD